MLKSFSEFKFFQSFRIGVEKADNLRFLAEVEDDIGNTKYVNDAVLIDISLSGLGIKTKERIQIGAKMVLSLQFKKHHLDLSGKVVRAFSYSLDEDELIYGIEIDEDKEVRKFLEHYIYSFTTERLKDCLIDSALKERYSNASDGFEIFSLLLSLFTDITHYGDKEGFIENMLEEVVRVMNAQRASIFLINPETNELEAIGALGVDKGSLKFDYRLGIAGSVFTTGVALNIDTKSDRSRFNNDFDKQFHFETKSIICHPIHNREDKIVGVIEVINKRNQDRFTIEDEKTMKVLTLMFSSVFHNFNPVSEVSKIRRFSMPCDRKNALIGKVASMGSIRNTIVKLKDLDTPVLVHGERGVGKNLYSKILHHEGSRGLRKVEVVNCNRKDKNLIQRDLFDPIKSKFVDCQGGTVILQEVSALSLEDQEKLYSLVQDGGIVDSKVSLDARIIATTTKDLGQLSDEGTFDTRLYEFLSQAYVYMEPLRRKVDDIPLLVDYFSKVECKKQGLLQKEFSKEVIEDLKNYDWPGNIKELKMCIDRAILYNPKSHRIEKISFEDETSPLYDSNLKKRVFGELPFVSDNSVGLKDRVCLIERELILQEIKRHNGNKSKAAKAMGISREALRKKIMIAADISKRLEGQKSNEDSSNNVVALPKVA